MVDVWVGVFSWREITFFLIKCCRFSAILRRMGPIFVQTCFALLPVVDVDSQKRGAISLRLHRSRLMGEIHYLDCYLFGVSADSYFVKDHEKTLCSLSVALRYAQSELTGRQLPYFQYFIQDMTHVIFWDTNCLSKLAYVNTRSWPFVMLSSVLDVFEAPEHGSLNTDGRPS